VDKSKLAFTATNLDPAVLELIDQIVLLDPFRSVPTVCGALGIRDLGLFDLLDPTRALPESEFSESERADYTAIVALCAERAIATADRAELATSTVQ
jgi:hypothetical protein